MESLYAETGSLLTCPPKSVLNFKKLDGQITENLNFILTKQSALFVYKRLRSTLFCYDSNFKSAEGVCKLDSWEGVGK